MTCCPPKARPVLSKRQLASNPWLPFRYCLIIHSLPHIDSLLIIDSLLTIDSLLIVDLLLIVIATRCCTTCLAMQTHRYNNFVTYEHVIKGGRAFCPCSA